MSDGGDTYPTLRAAAVQMPSVFLDRASGVERACELIDEAAKGDADLVVFPESFIPGHPLWLHYLSTNDRRSIAFYERLFANSVTVPGADVTRLCQAASDCNINVVIGVTEKRAGTMGTLFNSQLFLARDGSLLGKHQKLVPTVREKVVHAQGAGDSLDTFEMDFGRVGGLICGENSNALASYALQALGESVHAGSWPPFMGFRRGAEVVDFVSRAMAYAGHIHVVSSVGTVGDDFIEMMGDEITDGDELRSRCGGSSIVGPAGQLLAGPMPGGEEGVLYADLDLGRAVRGKLSHDFTGHYNRFDVFELKLRRNVQSPLVVEASAARDKGEVL